MEIALQRSVLHRLPPSNFVRCASQWVQLICERMAPYDRPAPNPEWPSVYCFLLYHYLYVFYQQDYYLILERLVRDAPQDKVPKVYFEHLEANFQAMAYSLERVSKTPAIRHDDMVNWGFWLFELYAYMYTISLRQPPLAVNGSPIAVKGLENAIQKAATLGIGGSERFLNLLESVREHRDYHFDNHASAAHAWERMIESLRR